MSAIIRGETPSWSPSGRSDFQAEFLEACVTHGVALLITKQLKRTSAWEEWPPGIRAALESLVIRQAGLELLLERELVSALESLAERGVQPLILKGTALAYTHYPFLGLRPRNDTDLLIHPKNISLTEQVLAELGFQRLNMVSGSFIMHQSIYVKEDRRGVRHTYDVHWKISNPQLFADILSYDELARCAITVPGLGENARALDAAHALLLACLHRIAHHQNSDCLIWLYDIHLLVSQMRPEEHKAFSQLAIDKRVRAVCSNGLKLAQHCFYTPLPVDLMEALHADGNPMSNEATASFLKPYQRRIDVLLSDLRTLSRWRDKLQLLKEHVFPPANYILNHYSIANRALLPGLYVHRALQGAWKFCNGEATKS
ncbi:MAG: nucleotidyltransferase family protein [Candidatus Binatia bacterium]